MWNNVTYELSKSPKHTKLHFFVIKIKRAFEKRIKIHQSKNPVEEKVETVLECRINQILKELFKLGKSLVNLLSDKKDEIINTQKIDKNEAPNLLKALKFLERAVCANLSFDKYSSTIKRKNDDFSNFKEQQNLTKKRKNVEDFKEEQNLTKNRKNVEDFKEEQNLTKNRKNFSNFREEQNLTKNRKSFSNFNEEQNLTKNRKSFSNFKEEQNLTKNRNVEDFKDDQNLTRNSKNDNFKHPWKELADCSDTSDEEDFTEDD